MAHGSRATTHQHNIRDAFPDEVVAEAEAAMLKLADKGIKELIALQKKAIGTL